MVASAALGTESDPEEGLLSAPGDACGPMGVSTYTYAHLREAHTLGLGGPTAATLCLAAAVGLGPGDLPLATGLHALPGWFPSCVHRMFMSSARQGLTPR